MRKTRVTTESASLTLGAPFPPAADQARLSATQLAIDSVSGGGENWASIFSEFALARGQWHLERTKLDNVEGLFTLVLKKFPDGWKIIHDHSSS